MNAEQIRAEAIEVVVKRMALDEIARKEEDHSWQDWYESGKQERAESVLEALAVAGLLPTRLESRAVDGGVEWTHGDGGRSTLPVYGTEERYVTEWRQVGTR